MQTSYPGVTIRFVGRAGSVTLAPGRTLLEAAREAGVEVNATCGGRGRCRGCRIKLTAGTPPPPTPADSVQLGADEIREGYRLACQYRVDVDATVQIAPPAAESAFQIMTATGADQDPQRLVLDSGVRKHYVPAGSVAGEQRTSALEALSRRIGFRETPGIGLKTLRRLPAALSNATEGVTVTTLGNRIAALEPGDTRGALHGMAFDIGTTTVVGYLIDLSCGATLATVSGLNPQAAYGGDLISRIAFARQSPRNLAALRTRIVTFVNALIGQACAEAGIGVKQIYKVLVVGNTCMHHLFLGIDPTAVGLAPYTPVMRQGYRCPARSVGLRAHPEAGLIMLALVAGFVGADTVAMVLATRIDSRRELCVAVDIGTNAEVVMGNCERLFACSSPAGPALEGGQIHAGMRAALGAIDRCWIDGDIKLGTLGGLAPIGICGSGLVDIIAVLLDAGILAASGRLLIDPQQQLPKALRSRLREDPAGVPQFVLVRAHESGNRKEIVLDQKDIRQVQLAKAAIRAGTTALAQVAGVVEGDLAECLLAGGFGNYLNLRNARRIGLIPGPPMPVHYVANAAGLGAQLALLSEREYRRADDLARRIEHISLTEHPNFQRIYLDALAFPARFGAAVADGEDSLQGPYFKD